MLKIENVKNMTREELFKRVDRIREYWKLRGYESSLISENPICSTIINRENLEKSEDMCNFTLEFLNLLDKYNPSFYTTNGAILTFGFNDGDKKRYISADYFVDTSLLRCPEEKIDGIFNHIYMEQEAARKYVEKERQVFDIEKIGEFLVSNSEELYKAANTWSVKGWSLIFYWLCLACSEGRRKKQKKQSFDYSTQSGITDILWTFCRSSINTVKLRRIYDDVSAHMIDAGMKHDISTEYVIQDDVVHKVCECFAEQLYNYINKTEFKGMKQVNN